jgi:hypothetical protein
MARRVFFSFHYDRDVVRVSQVRNCNVVTSDFTQDDFLDAADWETVKIGGDAAIKKWIDTQLKGTSVTVVLIGRETSERKYVKYEIEQSWNTGNGMIGIYIHNATNFAGQTDIKGANPFETFHMGDNQNDKLSNHVKTYDWINDNGRQNIGAWIEQAAKDRGR